MIVPFLFTLDEYAKDKPTHQWVANKFYDFCHKYHFPCIMQEKFTQNPSYYEKKGHRAMSAKLQEQFHYQVLTDEEFRNLDKKNITEEEERKIVSLYKNHEEAAVKLLCEENCFFEKVIEEKIQVIENQYQEKIEAIFTWIWYPSLEKIAKKHNIEVLNYELSTIRIGRYRETLGYFKFGSKYNNNKEWQDFVNFKYDRNKLLLLNNKEIVALFIDDEHVAFINEMDKNPTYEVGLALGLKKDYFLQAYDGKTYDYMLKKVQHYIPNSKISLRSHPSTPFDETKYHVVFDHSFEAIEWITKCRSIVCAVSNIGYEAILFNRGVISTNANMVTSFGKENSLDYYDPKYYGLLELNYLTFVYYAPYDLMFDLDYIRYRLKEKNVYHICNYHLNYILRKYNLSVSKLKAMSSIERFQAILDTHHITNELKNQIMSYVFDKNMEEDRKEMLYQRIEKLEELNKETNLELTKILNSKGWQFLEKVRKLKNHK